MKSISESMRECFECSIACEHCVTSCINEGMPMSCCNLCRDCADICRMCIAFESRDSQYLKELCTLCARICHACAIECQKHADKHEHCKACAEACLRCAKACEAMAA